MKCKDCKAAPRWKPLVDFPKYEISHKGDVRSLKTLKILKPGFNHNGYKRYNFSDKKRRKTYFLHKLVLLMFLGPKPNGCVSSHKDGSRAHNCISNLRWLTFSENEQDKKNHGTYFVGDNHHLSKITSKDASSIRRSFELGEATRVELAGEYGISYSRVNAIIAGSAWRDAWNGQGDK